MLCDIRIDSNGITIRPLVDTPIDSDPGNDQWLEKKLTIRQLCEQRQSLTGRAIVYSSPVQAIRNVANSTIASQLSAVRLPPVC